MFDVIIVGLGVRGMIYGKQSLRPNSRFRVVGIVEPDKDRRKTAKAMFSLPDARCFTSVEEVCREEKFADAVFNCTMDHLHAKTAVPLLEKGYDMLLEKPVAPTQEEAEQIASCAKKNGCFVMVCHVLRYTPFYKQIKACLLAGTLGRITNIQMAEQVSYYHASVSYVRGKFAEPDLCGSSLLLSKCCHDLDLLAWFMEDDIPEMVFSSGSVSVYKPEGAPADHAERCLPDCPQLATCPYAADRLYVRHPQRWANRVMLDCGLEGATDEEKIRALADPENRYGRCVYRPGLQLVDHQSVLISFASGATGTFSVTEGSAVPSRTIHIIGTKAELRGQFETGRFTISHIAPEKPGGCTTSLIDLSAEQIQDEHGGGDDNILNDFFDHLSGMKPSISCSTLEQTMIGHSLVYRAERSRQTHLPE